MSRLATAALLAALLVLPAAGRTAQPAAPGLRFTPPAPGSYELPPIRRLAPHRLLDTKGAWRPILSDSPGQLTLVSFIYLHCGYACPLTTALLQRLDHHLAEHPDIARHVRLVTVSFDPARDTPAAMQRQRHALHPQSRWRFLTAPDPAALAPVLQDFGQDLAPAVALTGVPTGQLQHVLRVFLVDDHRAIRNIYSTGFLDERILWNDLLTLLAP